MRGLISMMAMRSASASYIISILNKPLSKPSPAISRVAMSAMRACTPRGRREGYSKREKASVPGNMIESTTPEDAPPRRHRHSPRP